MSNSKNNEKGFVTILVVALMLFIMIFAGVFINVIMNYTNINVVKKSMQEATRTRALSTDIYMKERYGLIEAVYPVENIKDMKTRKSFIEKNVLDVKSSNAEGIRQNDFVDPLTNIKIPNRISSEYKAGVKYADFNAKQVMIDSVNAFVGNRVVGNEEDKKMVVLNEKNICFDVRPIPETTSEITFSCNVEDNTGTRHRITSTLEVSGYKDLNKQNIFNLNDTTSDDEGEIYVTNVVFGAAVITPKLYMPSAISSFTFNGEENQFIYSLAYPQIDTCYSENEC